MAQRKPQPLPLFLPHPRPFYPWFIWFLAVLFQFYKLSVITSPSVISSDLMATFNITASEVATLAAWGIYPLLLFQFPLGILIDNYGTRRITSLGILITALGAILFGYSPNLTVAYIARFIMGAGTAVSWVNIVKIISDWFRPQYFALMVGLSTAVGILGVVFGQLWMLYFSSQFGWRFGIIDLGLIGLIFAVFFFAIVKDREPGAQYNMNPKSTTKFSKLIVRFLKNKQTWIISVFSGLSVGPIPVFMGIWGIHFLRDAYSLSLDHAFAFHAIYLIAAAIFCPFIGYFSTKLKNRKIFLQLGSLVFFLLLTVLIFTPNIPLILLGIIFFFIGVAVGALPLSYVLIHEHNYPKITASAVGLSNSFFSLFGGTGDELVGHFLASEWRGELVEGAPFYSLENYELALLRLPIWLFIAFILSFFIKRTYAKQKIEAQKQFVNPSKARSK